MIKNQNGSILIVTLGFIFVFTLLGFGSLHYAYMQNENVEKEKASAEAFWLADGALEMALDRLQTNSGDLIDTTDYSPTAGDLKQYDVISREDSCPPPVCSDAEKALDPELPECSDAERSMDPILCDSSERYLDPALCDWATRIPDLSDCTAEDRLEDPDGLGRCPCEINDSCTMYCPCHYGSPPCVGRCPCEYAAEDPCVGRCPCEITEPPSCPCHETDTCPENMIGRCTCVYDGSSCCESFVLQSYGEVNYRAGVESRAILAKCGQDFGDRNIENALETWGWVNKDHDCLPDGDAAIDGGCEQQRDFTFESVFGNDQQWFYDHANNYYLNPDNNFEGDVSGITWIEMTDNNNGINITEDKLPDNNNDGILDAAVLIIDTTGVNENKLPVRITIGGNGLFRGIVWIIGEAQFVGTSQVQGAIFVAGETDEETKVSGTTDIYFSPSAIAEAIDSWDGEFGNEEWSNALSLISWREIDMNKADY